VNQDLPSLLIRRMHRSHWIALDCAAAAVLLVALVARAAAVRPLFGVPGWLVVAACAATALPIAVRRLWPVAAFGTVLAADTLLIASGGSGDPGVAVALALYTVAVCAPSRRSLAALTGGLAVTVAAEAYAGVAGQPPLRGQTLVALIAATTAVAGAGWAIGAAAREQRRYAAWFAEELARRAVTDERLRIARELHDVISHSMTLITAKAGVTNYLLRSDPDEARSALALIETTGRDALAEMRRLLGVLRADGDSQPRSDATAERATAERAAAGDGTGIARAPAPGLSGLETLASQATAAGVRTRLDVRGGRELPEAMALSVYRIVQEALTNVIKHAGPARCDIQVDLTGEHVTIDVSDDGCVPPQAAAGHGLVGMRERVGLFGGEFTAGPRPDGGYRVAARLPLSPARAAIATPEGYPA
jgi:signal transduction histidine kinase